jgi:hypothetical protein
MRVYGQAVIECISQTSDLPPSVIRTIYSLNCVIESATQATNALVGRDRILRVYTARSAVHLRSRGQVKRHSQALVVVNAPSKARWLTTIPAIPAPIGQLWLEGKPLKNRRLPRGKSQTLAFTISGKRLKGLQIQFFLRSLKGEILLSKSILVAPGGVAINELVDNGNGSQTIAGFILLLPHETFFDSLPGREIEVNYIFQIGNDSSREHLLESDFINFYTI